MSRLIDADALIPDFIECSQCGEKYVVQHMEDEKYCRNCGAKMEVEK